MKKTLSLVIRLLLAAAGIVYIVLTITWRDQFNEAGELVQQGLFSMLATARWQLLAVGCALVAIVFPLQALRWFVLMRARGMTVTLARAMRLTLVGTFFNFCMPGTTGGDVIKAWYAAVRSDRRTDAVMSVIVDRAVGLIGLILLSGVVGLFMLEHAVVRQVTASIWLLAAALAVGGGLYFSHTVRRMLPVGRWMNRVPGGSLIRMIDAAALAYRSHLSILVATVILSAIVHIAQATAAALAGYALGMTIPMGVMLCVIPAIFLLGAVPLTPQGFGVMEFAGAMLLQTTDQANANQIIAMLLISRLYQIAFGLLGALLLLKGDIHLHHVPLTTIPDADETRSVTTK